MNTDMALRLFNTGKLTVEQMLEAGNKANHWSVWEAVVKILETKK